MTTPHADEKKPAQGGLTHSFSMDTLVYVEQKASLSLEIARKSYDDLHERAYKLATLLVGGGGAIGAYALAKITASAAPMTWAPLAALALSWLAIAGQLIWVGATSNRVSPGNGSKNLLGYHKARVEDGWSEEQAFSITREKELELMQTRLYAYMRGGDARVEAIDLAYRAVAIASPLVPLLTALALHRMGY